MHKKISFILLLILNLAFISTTFAAKEDKDFKFGITDSAGVEKTAFKADEIPWLSANLKNKDSSIEGWWRIKQEGAEQHPIGYSSSPGGNIHQPMTTWGWSTPRAATEFQAHLNGYGTKDFTVAPEPVSSALFLLGGAALAAAKKRRTKK